MAIPSAIAVHPHTRGANVIATPVENIDLYGSSPHAWGQCLNPSAALHKKIGSSPHAWGWYFKEQSYCWILMS